MFYICSKFQKQFPLEETSGFIIDDQDIWHLYLFLQKHFLKSPPFVDWKWCVLNGFIVFFFFWLLSKNFLFHGIKSSGNLCQTVVDNIIRRINLCWWKMRYLGIQCIYVFLVCDVSQRTVWSDSWVSEEKRISLSGVLSKDWT